MDTWSWLIIGLLIVGFINYLYLSNRLKKLERNSGFEPRNIIIFPHWHKLLTDYHVIDKIKLDEVFRKCQEDNKFTEGKWHVLNNGISFTILKWDEHSSLAFDNCRGRFRTFSSRSFIREVIEEIEQYDSGRIINEPYHPEFYVKKGFNGFELGITTAESFSKVGMVGDDNELIKVGTIPYSYIFKRHLLPGEVIQKDLENFEWEEHEFHDEERLGGAPLEINHNYFRVYIFFV
jgi:hypothetical protein